MLQKVFKSFLSMGTLIGLLALGGSVLGAEVDVIAPEAARQIELRDALREATESMSQAQLVPTVLTKMWDFAGVDENGEAWIDGETLRFMFAAFLEDSKGQGTLVPLLTQLKGIKLTRDSRQLYVSPIYQQKLTIDIRPLRDAPMFQLYQIEVPAVSKFGIRMDDGILRVTQLYQEGQSWTLKVNIPVLPDRIYLHRTSLDLVTGEGRISAGVMGDLISVVAATRLQETNVTFDGIRFWESFLETFRFQARDWDSEAAPPQQATPDAGNTENSAFQPVLN